MIYLKHYNFEAIFITFVITSVYVQLSHSLYSKFEIILSVVLRYFLFLAYGLCLSLWWWQCLIIRPVSGRSDEKNQTRQQDAPSGSLLSRSSRRRQRYSCKCLTCVFLTCVWHPPSVDWKSKTAAPPSWQIPAQPGRDAKMIHSIASLIRAKSKLLVLENPDTVEIYKVRVQCIFPYSLCAFDSQYNTNKILSKSSLA